ncbi:hypothetical protein ACLKA7_000998 [Drosophila subpalustris]
MGANTSSSGYPTGTPAENASANSENGNCNISDLHASMGSSGSNASGGGPGTSVAYSGIHYHRDQRRKRVTGFATLKRKFIRRRRSSKACDHARVLRDFVCDWTPLELAALFEEFEALAALRDLSVQAELARPPATTYKQDLAALYDLHLCTDCDLVFRGSIFPVHRSILSSRCTYFRDLLSGCPGFGARICLELPSSPIDVQIFASLLRYLYTGDLCPHDPNININLLRQLGDDFGTPNPLEHDLRYLLETGDYADAALVFTAEGTNDCLRQDSELEVLQAVLKWGEQELIRRMEDREPNLLSHTAHSVARKGVKRRDLSDIELREILSELLPLVRMDHVLPPNSEVLCQAIRRGLVSTPPSQMIGDERENLRVNAWIRGGKNQGLFVRPRLFMPYFEEVKALLEDRMASSHHQIELMRMRRSRHFPDIPDTLYMVSRMNAVANSGFAAGVTCSIGGDNVGKLEPTVIPPPDSQTILAMRKREHKLRQSPMCQRALLLPLSSKHEIDRQIRLRVVREFNLPDEISDLLENALLTNQGGGNSREECNGAPSTQTDECILEDEDKSPPPSPAATDSAHHTAVATSFLSSSSMASSASSVCGTDAGQPCYSRNLTFPRHQSSSLLGVETLLATNSGSALQSSYARLSASVHHRNELPALITEGDFRFPHSNALSIDRIVESGSIGLDTGNGHLSDMMPDVAMATASLGQLHLTTAGSGCVSNPSNRLIGSNSDMSESLQLDLGDGPSPHIISSAAGVITLRNLQHQLPQSNYNHIMQRSNSPFDILRQGQLSPAPQHHPSGALNSGPPRFL